MAADANNLEIGDRRRPRVEALGVGVRHAEFVLAQAGGDVRVSLRVDVGIDAQRDRRTLAEAAGDGGDTRELGFRLDVEAGDAALQRKLDLVLALADARKERLSGITTCSDNACEFAT